MASSSLVDHTSGRCIYYSPHYSSPWHKGEAAGISAGRAGGGGGSSGHGQRTSTSTITAKWLGKKKKRLLYSHLLSSLCPLFLCCTVCFFGAAALFVSAKVTLSRRRLSLRHGRGVDWKDNVHHNKEDSFCSNMPSLLLGDYCRSYLQHHHIIETNGLMKL